MKRIQGMMPALMTILGFLIIGYRGTMEFMNNEQVDVKVAIGISCLIYAVWLSYESRVTRGEVAKEISPHDKFSMEFCAVVKISLLATFFWPPMTVDTTRMILGFNLAVAGIGIRAWGIGTLGSLYSHRIRIPERVIRTGPYGIIRHPAYLGTAVAHAGFTLVFLNPFSFGMLMLWIFAVWLRVFMEEKAMADHEEYSAYKKVVRSRVIPGIW